MKPNLRKMFDFHTIILLTFVLVVSTLHIHSSEGKLQRLHKHHHQHNYKQHNVVVSSNTYGEENDDDENTKQQQQQHGQHNHLHSHHKHHNHHHGRLQQQLKRQHYDATTPSLDLTTISSSSSSSSPFSSDSSSSTATVSSDNEFLIKQQEQPLTHKDDEFHYKTKDQQSFASTSTTSKPSLSIHLIKQSKNVHNFKKSTSNATSAHAELLALNSKRAEHTHHSHNKRLISTPLTKPEGNNSDGGGVDFDNNRTATADNVATMFAEGLEYKNYNWNLPATNEDANIRQQQEQRNKHRKSSEEKPVYENDPHQRQQNYDDYYSDAEDDEIDEDVVDDDYSEDEGDNDGISYEDDKNFSDRSYARITRSKLDDDYIDDEPYRNGINELSMQRDAAPGVLTEQKYLEVGNEKAVQQARERYIQEQKKPRTPHELATEHWHRMIQATKCRKPLPRVIPVSNNTSKRYEPYATILHRCGDDTGCCGSTASVCTVKRHEIVMVYVFSYDFNYRKEIEALPMQNHTECHCVNRGSLLYDSMPRDKRSGGSGSYLHHLQRQQRRQQQHQSPESQSYTQLQYHHQQQMQNMLDCHCPRHFNVFEEDVERHVHLPKPHSVFIRKCRCDCLSNNQTCLRFKHGEEGFSLEDRKCVLERSCKPPVCLYGDYNLRVGRCPSYRSHFLQTT